MIFIRSSARFQHSFLSLDDRIGSDNVIRYIDEVCNIFISSNIDLFYKGNLELIRGLFIFLMGRFKEQGLATGRSIAVDGTKIKAYAAKEIRLDGLKKKLENIEGQLSKYLDDLASIDEAEDSIEELEEKKDKLSAEVEELELIFMTVKMTIIPARQAGF